jgi:hypothetical protein
MDSLEKSIIIPKKCVLPLHLNRKTEGNQEHAPSIEAALHPFANLDQQISARGALCSSSEKITNGLLRRAAARGTTY